MEAVAKIAPTPQQAINMLAGIKLLGMLDKTGSGGAVSDAVLDGELKIAWLRSQRIADEFLFGQKRAQLLQLITQVGVVKVAVALATLIAKSLTEAV